MSKLLYEKTIAKVYNTIAPVYDLILPNLLNLFKLDDDLIRVEMIEGLGSVYNDVPIIDIGCGTGRNLTHIKRLFPDNPIYGMDISEGMLGIARRRFKAENEIKLIWETSANWQRIEEIVGREYYLVSSLALSIIWGDRTARNGLLTLAKRAIRFSIMDANWELGLAPLRGLHMRILGVPFCVSTSFWNKNTAILIAEFIETTQRIDSTGLIAFIN